MCGEHTEGNHERLRERGSSPHVRGTPSLSRISMIPPGIIPACAGNTSHFHNSNSFNGDHPRMCGEHSTIIDKRNSALGSSPHVRGTQRIDAREIQSCGIIPACAGNTWSMLCCQMVWRDHPRMCGEHSMVTPEQSDCQGSSPHVRGTPEKPVLADVQTGIIPACAGNTTGFSFLGSAGGDHPRMCGEHTVLSTTHRTTRGSSPHVRGTPCPFVRPRRRAGIIPACAGNTRCWNPPHIRRWDHPRMCGEHNTVSNPTRLIRGSSPHVRGTLLCTSALVDCFGIIPACAGNT